MGLTHSDTRARLAYGPRAELGVDWKIVKDLGLFARVGMTLPLRRYAFQIDHRPLYQPNPVSLRATIGVAYSL